MGGRQGSHTKTDAGGRDGHSATPRDTANVVGGQLISLPTAARTRRAARKGKGQARGEKKRDGGALCIAAAIENFAGDRHFAIKGI
jgi:hypothetical protein